MLHYLDYGNYGIFLIMRDAGFRSSTLFLHSSIYQSIHPCEFFIYLVPTYLSIYLSTEIQGWGSGPASFHSTGSLVLRTSAFQALGVKLVVWEKC